MKFQKGQSGNPGGRPKVLGEVQDLARQHTTDAVETLASIMRDKNAVPAARVAAANAILDRGYGKPPQHISGEFSQRYVAELPEVCEDADDWERRYAPKRH
jgi:hypothetical protein